MPQLESFLGYPDTLLTFLGYPDPRENVKLTYHPPEIIIYCLRRLSIDCLLWGHLGIMHTNAYYELGYLRNRC